MRTERGGEGPFYHALAALLFAAACAWLAAALYRGVPARAALQESPPTATPGEPGRFRGVLLRREERFPPDAFPGTAEGARLSAAETGTESALCFTGCDGWETLSPDDAGRLSPDGLDRLLAAPENAPDENARRLVYGWALWCAAWYEGPRPPAPGPVRLRPDGADGALSATLLSAATDATGRTALLLRLTEFPQAWYTLRFVEGEIK